MARSRTQERRQQLIGLLRSNTSSVEELATVLGVSPSTVRRDLSRLQASGEVARTYGGALLRDFREQPFATSRHQRRSEKAAIAAAAAELVGESARTVFIDAGSTCLALANLLSGAGQRTIVTRGLEAAAALVSSEDIDLILLGGRVRRLSHGLTGPLSALTNARLSYDIAFLGADVVDPERGLGEPTLEETAIKEDVARHSRRVVVLADATKAIGPVAPAWLPFAPDWTLITDPGLDSGSLAEFRHRLNVIVAG